MCLSYMQVELFLIFIHSVLVLVHKLQEESPELFWLFFNAFYFAFMYHI